ncbi:molybdenum cofactor guanylyltransferase [Polaribacter reichenbachii]|uniref:Molybdopterin-guanine dinucleotide biosynthesis protein MobA n=1 Tax=Polaribacter reichenbachii TaxID=996801 RepID=A0A1B8U5X7_9FLAO|nr:NTP transferase domain-containing protein [Polaribacter reichenbachii]APZ46010.1 molybdenum cofactor guanylyltransferase [Polaribacter reichenbachii]AUC19872.1 molybdenum cofactor guanylyltransferase [Polaribacter reichenbachii]OBY67273.1 molybdopterin-guanine dinucleotide biosynthesis protein MobA [Polaribacter reichenbachii]
MAKHKKHTNLERRNNDDFAPNEIAILGTNCGVISDLVHKVSQKLSNYKLAYFDASHAKNVEENKLSEYVFHHQGNLQITTSGKINKFQQRLGFAQFDYVFINGNHYQGAKQILILDEAKDASVLKRLDQIQNIQFIVKLKPETEYFPFLEEKYPQIKNITCYTIDEIDAISNHINNLIQEKIAPVKGLVLVGGKSTRMGKDKSELNYFGKPQKEFAKELLENNNLETFYSVQNSSEKENEISDKFLNLGPFGGICSAFQKEPNSAWFVLATDVPFVSDEIIQLVLQHRNPSKAATAIKGKGKQFVEPLITIYEPKAYPILLQYLAQGYSCPRKMLINSDVEIVEIDDAFIRNINTPEEFEAAKSEISN